MCFYCGGPNHNGDSCCAPNDDVKQYKAFVALHIGDTVDDIWYPDTITNQHMIANVTDAHGKHPFIGQDSIIVGNGDALTIFVIVNFNIPSIDVTLSNVLIVPTIKRDILLFSQFYKRLGGLLLRN